MNTRNWIVEQVVLLVMGISLLLGKSVALAQQPLVSDMLQRYGSSSSVGEDEGALCCIRCNFSPTLENLATCNKDGHEHFLLVKDGQVHPLYRITKDIADKINSQELHEKQVKIRGRYYPVANAILVSQVEPAAR
ncbi:MAG: hypothetical protein HYZ50_03170 [Deltaproteobacteria bacterium]|nr:hypothetical protein [Deltaproteobacteria bacterium]